MTLTIHPPAVQLEQPSSASASASAFYIASKMENLPPELKFIILGFLPKSDLKSMRLVSKFFTSIASQLLFDKIFVSVRPEDLKIFADISKHPMLSAFVKEIVYVSVYRLHTRQQTRNLFHSEEGSQLDRVESEPLDIASDLARMPNIKKVTFANRRCPPGIGNTLQRRVFYLDSVSSKGPTANDIKECDRGFALMCHALSETGTQIQSLVVDHYNLDLFTGPRYRLKQGLCPSTFFSSHHDLHVYCNAFRHLREVSLCLDDFAPHGETAWTRSRQKKLARALSSATELEVLSLGFNFRERGSLSLVNYLPNTRTWPRLRNLELFNMTTNYPQLKYLIHQHCGPLETLDLEGISLVGGNWKNAKANLRKESIPRYIFLYDVWDDASSEDDSSSESEYSLT
ncbi:hypothetical protein M426DRAFT_323094 [Hypoxylon sp. CI-4A]|nr:hypothetical protein M426DRAFT_323094 [Hypoxylon sp. CI-4A]